MPVPRHARTALMMSLLGLMSTQSRAGYDLATTPYLLGDWGGVRSRLADGGIGFDFSYGTESAHNFTGGAEHVTRYTDQLTFGSTLDMGKLWNWRGAIFRILITDRNGDDLGAAAQIGNNQLIQEVYGRGQTWHLTEMSLQQSFLGDRLSLKAGRMPVGEEFASFSCDFENLTFCGAQPGNLVGSYWVNWPTSLWSAVLKLTVTDHTYLKVGGYQVNPHYVDDRYAEDSGLLPTFPGGTTGALIPAEFAWTPTLRGRPGSFKIGGWYNTEKSADLFLDRNRQPIALTDGTPLEHANTFGTYINFQQQISGEPGGRGASLFFNATHADKDTTATNGQVALGVEYQGIFERPSNLMGLAIGATHANGRYGTFLRDYNSIHATAPLVVDDGYEYVGEIFYTWSPIRCLFIRPDLQYIVHPGGTTQNSDAFVLGVKTGIAF
jgi:porin